jgi:tight adherence protein C
MTAIELAFLYERRLAFEGLACRVNLASVRGVVTTMIQTERYGTPLASALRVLSPEFRNERMMRDANKRAGNARYCARPFACCDGHIATFQAAGRSHIQAALRPAAPHQ